MNNFENKIVSTFLLFTKQNQSSPPITEPHFLDILLKFQMIHKNIIYSDVLYLSFFSYTIKSIFFNIPIDSIESSIFLGSTAVSFSIVFKFQIFSMLLSFSWFRSFSKFFVKITVVRNVFFFYWCDYIWQIFCIFFLQFMKADTKSVSLSYSFSNVVIQALLVSQTFDFFAFTITQFLTLNFAVHMKFIDFA